ncbi:MFS transporter [Novosphingobium sp. JCM 18896]|uniref:MFS transporter n=1 Tax=Novosphingobium sp. JCM 18896 TaxID=2989731 RepID=UPI002221C60C|nr:MFS transporter [Novosphingobium sp. JCM 18896]MCW1431747.1 MFS transporter [Novosphingobium sp. JCM 18896]
MADIEPPIPTTLRDRLMQPGGALAPFKSQSFRMIWFANLSSALGSTIQSVGAAWLMTALTKSHILIATVQVSTTIPIMLLGIFAGAIADNFERRRIMLIAQVGMFVAAVLLALLTWAELMTPALLLALTLAVGTGTALNSPAWQASVRQQVGTRDLPQAISLNTIAFNLARSVGPALGGLLISLWNSSAAFLVNAICVMVMIQVLLRWRPEGAVPERKPMLPAIAIGLRFCAHSKPIRRILLRGMIIGFGVAGYQALVPAVVRDRLHGSEIDFGLMLGLFGIGSILAALFIGKARQRWGTESVLTLATLAFVAAQSVLGSAHSLTEALPATFLAGAAWVASLTTINVAMQMRSPEEIIGRCLSIYQAITFGGMALGSWVWGALADVKDLPFALHAASAFLLVTLVLMRLFAPMPQPHEGRVG